MALTKAHNRMIEGAAVNVKDFGAKGDGSTDDTAAIQAAIDYVEAIATGGGEVFFPIGVYIQTQGLTIEDSITTLRFSTGARLKATSAMNAQITMGDGVNRKEDIHVIGAHLDGNNLANYGVIDTGTRISSVKKGYFENHLEYHILQRPTTVDYSEFFYVKECQGFDAKGFYRHEATSTGRATDCVIEDCVMFRPTEWFVKLVSAQRFKLHRNMVGSQSNAFNGGVYISQNDTHTLPHTAEHIVDELYVESNTTYGSSIEAVVIENQSTSRVMSGCLIRDLKVQPVSDVAMVRISAPAAGGSRQHTIENLDAKGGKSNSITIGSNVAFTRIEPAGTDGGFGNYITDNGLYTVINGLLEEAAGKNNPVTKGGVGDITRNTSNDSFWTRDHDGNYKQVGFGSIVYSETRDLPSIAAGGNHIFDVTVAGVTLGDYVLISLEQNMNGLIFHAYARTGIVSVSVYNPTAGAIDIASTTLRFLIFKH